MKSDNSKNNLSQDNLVWTYLLNKYICEFIRNEWFDPDLSNNDLAKFFDVHFSIIAKIKSGENYNMPIYTLSKICYYKEMKMSDFFILLERQYGSKLYEDFYPQNE